jgi:hypothetical protein
LDNRTREAFGQVNSTVLLHAFQEGEEEEGGGTCIAMTKGCGSEEIFGSKNKQK